MALFKCRGCGGPVSSTDAACRKCGLPRGAKPPESKGAPASQASAARPAGAAAAAPVRPAPRPPVSRAPVPAVEEAAAPDGAAPAAPPRKRASRKLLLAVLILVVLALGVGGFAVHLFLNRKPPPILFAPPPLQIPADLKKELPITIKDVPGTLKGSWSCTGKPGPKNTLHRFIVRGPNGDTLLSDAKSKASMPFEFKLAAKGEYVFVLDNTDRIDSMDLVIEFRAEYRIE